MAQTDSAARQSTVQKHLQVGGNMAGEDGQGSVVGRCAANGPCYIAAPAAATAAASQYPWQNDTG